VFVFTQKSEDGRCAIADTIRASADIHRGQFGEKHTLGEPFVTGWQVAAEELIPAIGSIPRHFRAAHREDGECIIIIYAHTTAAGMFAFGTSGVSINLVLAACQCVARCKITLLLGCNTTSVVRSFGGALSQFVISFVGPIAYDHLTFFAAQFFNALRDFEIGYPVLCHRVKVENAIVAAYTSEINELDVELFPK